ncbi:DNA-binding transcriptional LysR family regulator [Scopulibacillus darangshiensis]|uniref:DNA-binding transcriptional LysR family regulator n=2 Tax=Scopulibacillus darangshiensis TaxID=442528 RepID=A0A4R2P433_9BACL|nr:DNA-binding transcriptional LysR family regulator [Scopulibacillus darangshiensis]
MRLLEYALEVYRHKNFTKAAGHLHIAQPSLSKQIAKLEQELGVSLFYRGHGAVEPTPDGVRFIEQAEKILNMRRSLEREMHERKEGIGGDLTIGTTAITGGHVLPPILRAFTEQYPNVRVRLVEEATAKLTELTAKGFIDVSILALPVEDARLTTKTMLTEPLYLVLPRTQKPWMSKILQGLNSFQEASVSLRSLSSSPLILLKQGFGFRRTVLELCAESGFQPQIAYETSSIETAQSLVMNGLGVTIVPEMVLRRDLERKLHYVKLDSNPTRTLVFAMNRERYLSMAAKALIKIHEEQGGVNNGGE